MSGVLMTQKEKLSSYFVFLRYFQIPIFCFILNFGSKKLPTIFSSKGSNPEKKGAYFWTLSMSHVMCHVSPFTWRMAKKNYVFFCFFLFFSFFLNNKKKYIYIYFRKKIDKVVEPVGGGSVINGAYPV